MYYADKDHVEQGIERALVDVRILEVEASEASDAPRSTPCSVDTGSSAVLGQPAPPRAFTRSASAKTPMCLCRRR